MYVVAIYVLCGNKIDVPVITAWPGDIQHPVATHNII